MSTTETLAWRRTSPAAAIFYIGKIIQAIAQNAIQTFAPLVAFLFAYEGDLKDKLIFGATAATTVIVVSSIVRYWFFRYCITDDSVLIREGVLKKTQLDIKFDRIQAINTEQNVIYRALNLVTAKFDTAGSSGQEGHLPAIKPELAETLRERIRRGKQLRPLTETEGEEDVEVSEELLTLGKLDMIRIGISDNRALIFLAFLGPLAEQIENRIPNMIEQSDVLSALATLTGIDTGPGLVFAVIVGGLTLLAIASIVGAFLRFHRYRLTFESHVYQSTGGLLTRHVHSIDRAKIQTVVMRQNVILRLLGRHRLDAKQATSGKKGSRKKNFAVPVCEPDQSSALTERFLDEHGPGLDTDPASGSFLSISPHYIRSRIFMYGIVPSVAATGLLTLLIGLPGLITFLWLPICALFAWQHYRRYGVQVARDGLALRRGFLGFRVATFLHRKVQRISITQTQLQRRKSLATMRFFLASGSVRLPYVNYEQAQILRDYVLFRVESSHLAWH